MSKHYRRGRAICRRGQAVLDYTIMAGVVLVITLVALGLLGYLPEVGLDYQTRQSITYWADQARPITVDAVEYRTTNQLFLALQTQVDEPVQLTSLTLNGANLAFYQYDENSQNHQGASLCGGQASCRSAACACSVLLNPRAVVRIVSEPAADIVPCGGAKTSIRRPLQLTYVLSADAATNLTEIGPLDLNIVCPAS